MCGKEGHQRLRDWESIGVFIPDILASIGVFTPNILVISALFYFTIYMSCVCVSINGYIWLPSCGLDTNILHCR